MLDAVSGLHALCLHEAAHAVLSFCAGDDVDALYLIEEKGWLRGRCETREARRQGDPSRALDRAAAALAGKHAAHRWLHEEAMPRVPFRKFRRPSYCPYPPEDRANAMGDLRLAAKSDLVPFDTVAECYEAARGLAERKVDTHWAEIEYVAGSLLFAETENGCYLDGDEVMRLINEVRFAKENDNA